MSLAIVDVSGMDKKKALARQLSYEARKREAGYVRVIVWVKKDKHDDLISYAKKINDE